MNVLELYLKLILLVVAPLALGMLFSGKTWSNVLSSRLFGIALYVFHTSIALLAVWQAQLANRSWMLPFIALAGWLLSIGVAQLGNRWMRHPPKQKGAFLFTICLSNQGYTLLGIIALVVFGEAGLAQAIYTQFFITPFLILVCFPLARHYSADYQIESIGQFLKQNICDKRNLPLLAMAAGLILNVTGVERPAVFSRVVPVVVYCGTVISGLAVGLLFNPTRLLKYRKENLFSIIYRSTFYPLFFFGAAKVFRLDSLDTLVLVLFGIVPSAVFSNLIADMFKLDTDLTNSVYIVSTVLFLIFALPLYLFAVGS